MKRYEVHGEYGPDSLRLCELTEPQPAPGEVLVRVWACSLNYRDLLVASGRYGGAVERGRVPLSDGAGEVLSVGEGVRRFEPGDRVASLFFRDWQGGPFTPEVRSSDLGGNLDGMLSEYVVMPENALIHIPEHLSFAEAAALPCAGVTAYHGLMDRGELAAGKTVLVMGTGGVSMFALLLAKATGAKVIATTSSDEKAVKLYELGAEHVVNYKTCPDWDAEIWRLTDKRGVDNIVEVGGAGTLERSINCLALGGHVALIGVLSGAAGTSFPFPLVLKNARMDGIYVGSRTHFEDLNRTLAIHEISPVIHKEFPFAEAKQAYNFLANGSHIGKVVINLDQE